MSQFTPEPTPLLPMLPTDSPAAQSSSPRSSAQPVLVWLRRDLRLQDHAALAAAERWVRTGRASHCLPVFVFDEPILAQFRRPGPEPSPDRRLVFLHETLSALQQTLQAQGSGLLVAHADAQRWLPELALRLGASGVVCSKDYEPQAIARDAAVAQALAQQGMGFESVCDQVVFEEEMLLTGQGRPYSVFTPYKRAWLKRLEEQPQAIAEASSPKAQDWMPQGLLPEDLQAKASQLPSLASMGFAPHPEPMPVGAGPEGAEALLQDFLPRMGQYQMARDFPGKRGPSYLSVHLRFGTVSIRRLVREARAQMAQPGLTAEAKAGCETWLSELIWRDFYMQILSNFPRVTERSFKPDYDQIVWADRPDLLAAWQEGRTGYPLVDAGMRQLNQTGYLHNRLRMVVASFLCKDLGIDWRHGEAYFAHQLNDFDLAANNGGWQWASSSGCDAQPYFRIFNPVSQSEKFDPKGQFIRRYLPELAGLDDKLIHAPWLAPALSLEAAGIRLGRDYPHPVVDHAQARAETLSRYAVVKQSGSD